MGQVLTKNEGFSDFCEGWVPFLLEIKQKTGWLVGMRASQLLPWKQQLPTWSALSHNGLLSRASQ